MKTFYNFEAYKMAAVVQECIVRPSSFIEVTWTEEYALPCLVKYSKLSLLHHYIFNTISVYYRQTYRADNDLMELQDVHYIEQGLKAYGISHQGFADFVIQNELEDGILGESFYSWFCAQHDDVFVPLWEYITDEVFQLLFSDRHFLLSFNESLATYLREGNIQLPPAYLKKSGKLRRCSIYPEWLKRAILYRDKGLCVFCHRDLTGLLRTDFKKHVDHIVPLDLWGTNDPCNLQLLCSDCNLNKGALPGATSPKYSPYWDE